ncbi:MAG TPA: deoxyribonuclease IV [Candidatus Acidoferrales bacterium]|nr:deoxyribonuclease IV [Candidatus Acidoferrales bacterium]
MPGEIHSSGLVYDAEDEYRPEPEPIPPPAVWLDGSFRIGIHTSIAGDIANSLDIAKKLGCNALQIFSSSPRMWPRPGRALIPEADAARFRSRRAELGLGPVAIHANYLINLAARDPVARVRAIQSFRDELLRGMSLGADFVIVHPGSARDGDIKRAASDVGEALRQSARGLKLKGLQILVENTAGMGNAVGSKFEELAAILEGAREIDAGVCIDTAHTFEAGYPIHTADGLEQALQHLEKTVQLDRVHVLHVNDSKTKFGSRVDRHQHIGKGEIGLEAMERILRHPLLSPTRVPGRAFLLETPIDSPGDDRRNVAAVWKCVGVAAEQMPDAEDGFSMVRGKRKSKTRAFNAETRRKQRSRGEGKRGGAKNRVTRGKARNKKGKRN